MVSLRASSPQSSSARPFSVLLRLKAMFLADRCLCSVKMFFSVWRQSGFFSLECCFFDSRRLQVMWRLSVAVVGRP
ncbi:hypothetical protein Bca4012_042902 [Brassica carinata]|uniref:Uncharacterized protein n=1 Tax=Brassica carinata TaxID=52824 RepID=A0A8X7QVH6_BRACI|nr:hypothetical protein Bca52824_059417 [Brassica carinata]